MDLEFIKRTVFENEDVVKDALNRYSKSEIFFAEGRTCVSIELDLNGDSFDRNLPSINQELGRLQVGNQDKLIYSIWVDERLPLQTEAVCIEQGLTNLAQNFPNLYISILSQSVIVFQVLHLKQKQIAETVCIPTFYV